MFLLVSRFESDGPFMLTNLAVKYKFYAAIYSHIKVEVYNCYSN